MTTHEFDAGAMGCGEGFAVAFRDRIKQVDVGDLLRVRTTDASAKEDLPSLARLMGHAIRTIEDDPDGSLTITVERRR